LPKGGRRRRGRFIAIAIVVLVFLIAASAAIAYFRVDRAVKASNAKVPADARAALTKPSGSMRSSAVNILLLGSDQRPDEPARADTILVLRVNGKTKTVSQLSIPRDTLVSIPGYDEGKINSAYAYEGPGLMIQTVQQLTGLPIHHYAEINFDGFPEIVDAVGGVDIDVPTTIDAQYPDGYDWTEVHFDAGPQKMDGEEALTYVRVRYSDDDFHRMARQQQFMDSLQKKFTSPTNMARLPLFAPTVVEAMVTDLSTSDLMTLGWIKFRTPAERNRKFVLEGDLENIGGLDYVVVSDSLLQTTVTDFLSS
jgi:LCP family protein required for cell wall assembly